MSYMFIVACLMCLLSQVLRVHVRAPLASVATARFARVEYIYIHIIWLKADWLQAGWLGPVYAHSQLGSSIAGFLIVWHPLEFVAVRGGGVVWLSTQSVEQIIVLQLLQRPSPLVPAHRAVCSVADL